MSFEKKRNAFLAYVTSDGTMIDYDRKLIGLPVPIPIIDYKICSRKSLSKPEIKWLITRPELVSYFRLFQNGEREKCEV